MNQNATTTSLSSSTSAASVANSSKAPTKSKSALNIVATPVTESNNNTTAATTTSVKSTSVILRIVASNQQFADQLIECDMLWTVKQLKSHLTMMYPYKPPIREQKIIYSGQLLKHEQLIKEVIQSYKDVHTSHHICHLVYTPKNVQNAPNFMQTPKRINATPIGNNMNANTANVDGLRQRNVAGARANATQMPTQHQQQQQSHGHQLNLAQPQLTHFAGRPQNLSSNPSIAVPFGMVGHPNVQLVLCNWIQQVYSQYMEEYMRRSNCNATGVSNIPTTPIALPPILAGPLAVNPFAQQLLCIPSPLAGVATTATSDRMRSVPSILSATQAQLSFASNTIGVVTETNLVNEPAPTPAPTPSPTPSPTPTPAPAPAQYQQLLEREQQPVLAQRFPNIVREDLENRDGMNRFCLIARVAILATIVYINTSPLRCLVVFLIVNVMCLLQIRRDPNNNNNFHENNVADQIRRGVPQVQQAARVVEEHDQNLGADAGADEPAMPAIHNRTAVGGAAASIAEGAENINTNNGNQPASVLSVVRSFMVAFFTSILPDAPQFKRDAEFLPKQF